MKRNLFLPEGADFSRKEVDKAAESLRNEANEKLSKLRDAPKGTKKGAPPTGGRRSAAKIEKESGSYAEILAEYQKKRKRK